MVHKVKGVTFDVDGTLYNMIPPLFRFAVRHIKKRDFLRAFLSAREEIRWSLERGQIKRRQAEKVAIKLNIDVEEAYRIIEEIVYGDWMASFSSIKPYPGLIEFLSFLKERSISAGIVSDFPCEEKLKWLGLLDYPWRVIVNAEEVGVLKPAPAPFLKACESMKLMPSEVLHIGDREELDVDGAINAGMKSALLVRRIRDILKLKGRAHYIFRDYRSLLNLFKKRGYV